MGLIKLSAEFRRRIERASGHSSTIPEFVCTSYESNVQSSFRIYCKHEARCCAASRRHLSSFETWRQPAFYVPTSNKRQLFFTEVISYFYSILQSEKTQNLNISTFQLFKITVFTDTPSFWSSARLWRTEFLYRVILWVLDPRKCEYLKDYSLDFEHVYMTKYLASWEVCQY